MVEDKDNTRLQRDVAITLERIGDVLLAAGDRQAALKRYSEGLDIRRRLMARDRDNMQWQHDVTVSLERMGGLFLATGDRRAALRAVWRMPRHPAETGGNGQGQRSVAT